MLRRNAGGEGGPAIGVTMTRSILLRRSIPRSLLAACSLLAAALAPGCTGYQPLDTNRTLRERLADRLDPELAARVEIPYELDEATRLEVDRRLQPGGSERKRTNEILDFIFASLDLEYALEPTRNAVETFRARQGNCLSFVNLFVGVARYYRLNPFYVEVQDYQRWNYEDGVVVSRGHIVAGMHIAGDLSTFDFLPYRPKSYKDFRPITDVQAMAHYYNNLGAEALIHGDLETARENLAIAVALAPDFDKALNNLGIVYLRSGDYDEAIALYEKGLSLNPTDVPMLSNLARAYQQEGDEAKAEELLDRLEESNEASPFFYVYRGDQALAANDLETALDYMRQAFRADSELPEVHLGLVRVYLAMGKFEEARHHVSRAIRLDATNEEARKYAAMLSQK